MRFLTFATLKRRLVMLMLLWRRGMLSPLRNQQILTTLTSATISIAAGDKISVSANRRRRNTPDVIALLPSSPAPRRRMIDAADVACNGTLAWLQSVTPAVVSVLRRLFKRVPVTA